MASTLNMDLTEHGFTQGDLHKFLSNVVLIINEILDDVVTNKTTIDECRTAIIELIDDHATFKTAVDGIGAKLDSDSGVNDTDYAATYPAPATLTAGDPTASAAAMTNSTDLSLSAG